jgi:hypothetical protein
MSDPKPQPTAKAGKERAPGDPGFWRRPLSNRTVWTIIVIAGIIVVAGIVATLALGVKLF